MCKIMIIISILYDWIKVNRYKETQIDIIYGQI